MRILISNDDGYDAEGVRCLYEALKDIAEVIVMAPKENCSGYSSALTLRRDIAVTKLQNGFYMVDGTPADCVHVGVNGFLDPKPDMVIAGINHGANLGDDVVYSGTIAAAIEGRFMRYPSMAFSLSGLGGGRLPTEPDKNIHFETASNIARQLVLQMLKNPMESGTILNVNVPNVAPEQLRGIRTTRVGSRAQSYPVVEKTHSSQNTPDNVKVFAIGPYGEVADAGQGSDFEAIYDNFVSITPLQMDMSRMGQILALNRWLEALD